MNIERLNETLSAVKSAEHTEKEKYEKQSQLLADFVSENFVKTGKDNACVAIELITDIKKKFRKFLKKTEFSAYTTYGAKCCVLTHSLPDHAAQEINYALATVNTSYGNREYNHSVAISEKSFTLYENDIFSAHPHVPVMTYVFKTKQIQFVEKYRQSTHEERTLQLQIALKLLAQTVTYMDNIIDRFCNDAEKALYLASHKPSI